jgi:hypothetical protein
LCIVIAILILLTGPKSAQLFREILAPYFAILAKSVKIEVL